MTDRVRTGTADLDCVARLHRLRVCETPSDPTGREVSGYPLVRGSVRGHGYALAIQRLTGVDETYALAARLTALVCHAAIA